MYSSFWSFPLNVLTIVLAQMNSAREQQRMKEEVQRTMDVAVANLLDDLDRAYKKELYLSFADSDFAVLERSIAGKPNSVIGEVTAGVNDKVKEINQDYAEVDLVYFYFPENEYLIANGSPGISRNCYKEYICALDENVELDYGVKWYTEELDGAPILVSFSKWRGAEFGVLINLDNLMAHINLPASDDRWTFFMSGDGSIYSNTADALWEESGMTYEEITASRSYEVYETPIDQMRSSVWFRCIRQPAFGTICRLRQGCLPLCPLCLRCWRCHCFSTRPTGWSIRRLTVW